MVSTVADTLFNRLLDAFPPGRDYTRQDYGRDPMPDAIVRLLDHCMQRRLEAAAPPPDDWFDADSADVQRAAGSYKEVLSRHQHIPSHAWKEVLRNACRQCLSYLVHPAGTLPGLVFSEGMTEASRDEVFARLDLFRAYPYFREVIDAYYERKSVDRIDRARFESLLRRIDRQMTADYDADDWIKLLQPLLEVVRIVPEYSGRLPVELLTTFFTEKGAEDIAGLLDTRYTSKGVRYISEADLHELISRKQTARRDDDDDLDEPMTEQIGGMVESAKSTREEGPLPLWKQFEQGIRVSSEQPSGFSPKAEAATEKAVASDDQPLWKRFRPEDTPRAGDGDGGTRSAPRGREAAATPIDDLAALERSVLGDRGRRNRDVFISHLFGGSMDDYQQTLRRLQQASSWSEASQVIAKEVFLKHQVNIYSSPAVAFTDAAEAQYVS